MSARAWFLEEDQFQTVKAKYERIPTAKKKKKKNDDETGEREREKENKSTKAKRSLAVLAAESQRLRLQKEGEEEEEKTILKSKKTNVDNYDDDKARAEQKENNNNNSNSNNNKSGSTLRAYAHENTELRDALRREMSRATLLEQKLEDAMVSVRAQSAKLKDFEVSHTSLKKDSVITRRRDRDLIMSLRKTLEERDRVSRGERARCGRALRYAIDCLRAHAPLAKDERNDGGSVLGSVVAELSRLTEIAVSCGDVGSSFDYNISASSENNAVDQNKASLDETAAEEENNRKRTNEAMRKANAKILELEEERRELLRTLETNTTSEYVSKDSFALMKKKSNDDDAAEEEEDALLFEREDSLASFRASKSATTILNNDDAAFELPGADALRKDIDSLDKQLAKLANSFKSAESMFS